MQHGLDYQPFEPQELNISIRYQMLHYGIRYENNDLLPDE